MKAFAVVLATMAAAIRIEEGNSLMSDLKSFDDVAHKKAMTQGSDFGGEWWGRL